jgi:hypothetical protein
MELKLAGGVNPGIAVFVLSPPRQNIHTNVSFLSSVGGPRPCCGVNHGNQKDLRLYILYKIEIVIIY